MAYHLQYPAVALLDTRGVVVSPWWDARQIMCASLELWDWLSARYPRDWTARLPRGGGWNLPALLGHRRGGMLRRAQP